MVGIKIISLPKIKNNKGDILKFLSKKSYFFKKFEKYIFQKSIKIRPKVGITILSINAIFQ